MFRVKTTPLVAAGALVAAVTHSPSSAPPPPSAWTRSTPPDSRRPSRSAAVLEHERVFQRIANQNGGTRASGTPGYDASATYVAQRLQQGRLQGAPAGVRVPVLPRAGSSRRCPRSRRPPTDYETGALRRTPAAATSPARSCRPTTSSSRRLRHRARAPAASPLTSPRHRLSRPSRLIQRGTCDFVVKADNAAAAGYDAAIIFNEGQPGRTDLAPGTLGDPVDIPVVALSFADGAALYAAAQAGPGRRYT